MDSVSSSALVLTYAGGLGTSWRALPGHAPDNQIRALQCLPITSVTNTPGRKVETARTYGRFGRSCRVCKIYFLTSDPSAYTCPWCQKGENGSSVDIDSPLRSDIGDTKLVVQEEV